MQFLTAFVEELRAVGIPVSMVETVDAARALEHVDLGSKPMVRAALAATMVKSARHVTAFDTVFETFFALRTPAVGTPEAEERRAGDSVLIGLTGAGGGEADLDAIAEALFRALLEADAGLRGAVVRELVARLAGMEPGRPVGGAYYLYRVLRELDLDAMEQRLVGDLAAGADSFEVELTRQDVKRRIEEFREELRTEIRRRLVSDRGPEAVARTLRRPLVEDVDLMTAGRDDLAALEQAVHPLTRTLATRLARRRRQGREGRLDVRKTVRRSLSTGGALVDPSFRRPRPAKPDIVILADISGSVATFARFTMQVVSAISSQFHRVRSFAFIDAIDEVTGYFGPGVDFAQAMRRIGTEAKVVWLDGHSDYGNAFGSFVDDHLESLTPRTSVIVTGDARSNYHDPNLPALREIAAAGRALYWLNPEQRRYWDTGDSIMGLYAGLCDEVHEVRNLRQLERFVEAVAIPSVRPVRRVV